MRYHDDGGALVVQLGKQMHHLGTILGHDKQADGSVAPTGHSPFIFLINKVEDEGRNRG